jgi:hypothetical protein
MAIIKGRNFQPKGFSVTMAFLASKPWLTFGNNHCL